MVSIFLCIFHFEFALLTEVQLNFHSYSFNMVCLHQKSIKQFTTKQQNENTTLDTYPAQERIKYNILKRGNNDKMTLKIMEIQFYWNLIYHIRNV